MHRIHIDFETRSAVDLRKTGTHAYAEHPTTDVWCAAYAINDGPIQTWQPGTPCPADLCAAVAAGAVCVAWNAAFDRIIWRDIMAPRYGWPATPVEQWRCSMVMSLAMGFPAALERAAPAFGLDIEKDQQGAGLMKRMARPREVNDDGTFVWWDEPVRIGRLIEYCVQDVNVEREIFKRLVPLTKAEQALWFLDQRINDRGLYIDAELCNKAKTIIEATAGRLNDNMAEVTEGLVQKCSNVAALAAWVRERGVEVNTLRKGDVAELLARGDLPDEVRDALELRRDAAKASVKKIDSALAGRSRDGRAKGLFFFNGAGTGRWSGRRVQPQNLQRPDMGVRVDQVIEDVMTGNVGVVELLHGAPLAAIGNVIRGIVRAAPGHDLIAADFANIEGRVLAWLAGETWKLQAFADFDAGTGPDLYKLAYARSFGVAPEQVNSDQRQIGKVMELALGYQGGVGAFQSMAAIYGVNVADERAEELKIAWRNAHPATVKLWADLEDAAFCALQHTDQIYSCGRDGVIKFCKHGSFMWVQLPSGRPLCYPYPRVTQKVMPWKDKQDRPVVRPAFTYKAEVNRQWVDNFAYGGLWAENIVQATARDMLAEAMQRLEAAGYPVVGHAHDEAVAEVPLEWGSVEDFCRTMREQPAWATGCPIAAAGWKGTRYRKA